MPRLPILIGAALLVLCACVSGGDGFARVSIASEHAQSGLTSVETADGWAISFEEVAVSLTALSAVDDEGRSVTGAGPAFVDLSASGEHELSSGITAPYAVANVSFRIAEPAPLVRYSPEYEWAPGEPELRQYHAAMVVKGSATQGTETRHFLWPVQIATRYADCRADYSGNDVQVRIEVERLFHGSQTPGAPPAAFQAISDADANGNGEITPAELQLAPIPSSWDVGDSGATNLWEWITYQARHLARVNGGVECGDTLQEL